jgi:DHA3 family macrolide efflux protein-like MFS transporter
MNFNNFPYPRRGMFGHGMGQYLTLWTTQGLSALGSSMTGFALVVWSYQQQGSALASALLAVSSYAPYVLLSIFAGALSDRWNKKAVMLTCDALAACSTVCVLILFATGRLAVWHLYAVNAVNGLMNTFQQPASEVAVSLLAPREKYQRVAGLQSFSNAAVTILTPAAATALLMFGGLGAVVLFDLATFTVAFLSLLLWIRLPQSEDRREAVESVWKQARQGIAYLLQNRGVLHMILFLAAINLTASIYEAALPAMLLSRPGGGETALGAVNTCVGVAGVVGSIVASLLPQPKSRVRVICNTLLLSMGVENLLLAFGRSLPVWCAGAVLGWLLIPLMNTNLNALLRSHIPVKMQGRVYAARNTLQFFTIPLGYLLGGVLVDRVFEPLMSLQGSESFLSLLFGQGKGSGAALLFLALAVVGEIICLAFRRDRRLWELERPPAQDEEALQS